VSLAIKKFKKEGKGRGSLRVWWGKSVGKIN
jgi:hypothetical protein